MRLHLLVSDLTGGKGGNDIKQATILSVGLEIPTANAVSRAHLSVMTDVQPQASSSHTRPALLCALHQRGAKKEENPPRSVGCCRGHHRSPAEKTHLSATLIGVLSFVEDDERSEGDPEKLKIASGRRVDSDSWSGWEDQRQGLRRLTIER